MKNEERVNKDLILRENLAIQRTILANQSTILAFLRTSMYFLIAGLSIDNLLKSNIAYKYIFFSFSGIIFIYGIINYFIQRKKIKQSKIHIGNFKDEYLF
ncbi:hypothetical protein Emtol_0762 [Emticicia oligotrophica DSM 17448]|uniref:DUF202 domain-containing protein n=1 Tax=Emticicia oligotrophica (strain DSM 17448 / CIP 109782 / MTCC 6937 / GPTSA100-15) TaxID=929562 RepID=A0ABM5MXQ1_EMTOG|nr:DUF202 domain-containing protein [Emticicia oligotrophica]AFK01914.1 hypothetical protein Emtol_0762 [Emticicia oligotrophica DSM 17448]